MKYKDRIKYLRYISQGIGIVLSAVGIYSKFPIMSTLLLGMTFIMGPIFCGWLCPFGSLQDIFSWIGKRLKIKKKAMPTHIQKLLSISRYALLGIALLVSTDLIFTMMTYDPQSNFVTILTGNAITYIGYIILIGFAFVSMIYDRPFCNYFCIEGAKNSLFGLARPVTITRNKNNCVGCGKCNQACPMHIDIMGHKEVRSLQCINCFECTSICPVEDTLNLGLTTLDFKTTKLKKGLAACIIAASISYVLFNVIDGLTSDVITETIVIEDLSEKSDIDVNIVPSDDSLLIIKVNEAVSDITSPVIDGIYYGTGTGFRGDMTAEVTIINQKITQVIITQTVDDQKWFQRAYRSIVSDILLEQSADVDTVSGATYSSRGIIEAVTEALLDAGFVLN